MSIKKVNWLDQDFTIAPNEAINDGRLSWAARGMLLYLCSKPETWEVNITDLVNQTKQASKSSGRDAVRSVMKELIDNGYMRKTQKRKAGKFASNDHEVCFVPFTENPSTVNPTQEIKELNKEKKITNNVESVRRSCDERLTNKAEVVVRQGDRFFADQLHADHQHCKTAMQILQELKADYPQIYDGSQAIEQWDLCELTLEWLTHSEYADNYASFNAMLRVLLESLLQLRFSASNDDSVGLPKLLCVNAEDGTLENIIEHEQILEA